MVPKPIGCFPPFFPMCSSASMNSPKMVTKMLVRISFGLSLVLMGIIHMEQLSSFSDFVGQGLGPIEPLGKVWGYILPFLMIVGGALFAAGMFPIVAVWAAGLALCSIPAGLLLKSAITPTMTLDMTMPYAINAFIWILVMTKVSKGPWCNWIKKADCCTNGNCGCGSSCACGPSCNCGTTEVPMKTSKK